MGLPPVAIRRSFVDVGADEKVSVRSLTSPEMAKIQKLVDSGDLVESEVAIVAMGTDTPPEEARAWYEAVPRSAVEAVLDEIQVLIGRRVSETSKSVPTGVHEG